MIFNPRNSIPKVEPTEEEISLRTSLDKGWIQTLFLQILKSLNFKISTKPLDSPSQISLELKK